MIHADRRDDSTLHHPRLVTQPCPRTTKSPSSSRKRGNVLFSINDFVTFNLEGCEFYVGSRLRVARANEETLQVRPLCLSWLERTYLICLIAGSADQTPPTLHSPRAREHQLPLHPYHPLCLQRHCQAALQALSVAPMTSRRLNSSSNCLGVELGGDKAKLLTRYAIHVDLRACLEQSAYRPESPCANQIDERAQCAAPAPSVPGETSR